MTLQLRVPLLNARTVEPTALGGRFSVRSATEEELARWAADPHVRDVVPHRVMPHIHSVLIVEETSLKPSVEQEEDVAALLALCSLYARRPVETAFAERWLLPDGDDGREPQQIGGTLHLPTMLPVSFAPPPMGPIYIDTFAQHLRTQLPILRSGIPFAPAFRYALARWHLGSSRSMYEDQLLDFWIALEAIFVHPEDHGDRSRLLRDRISGWFVATGGKGRRKMKADVYDAYDVRSRVTHGVVVDEARLSHTVTFLDRVLVAVLGDFVAGDLPDFDPRRYDAPGAAST